MATTVKQELGSGGKRVKVEQPGKHIPSLFTPTRPLTMEETPAASSAIKVKVERQQDASSSSLPDQGANIPALAPSPGHC